MNTADTVCRQCGTALPAGVAPGLCPHCALAGALEPGAEEEDPRRVWNCSARAIFASASGSRGAGPTSITLPFCAKNGSRDIVLSTRIDRMRRP